VDEQVNEEEILMMVDAGSEKGAIDEQEKEFIQNVFEFDDLTADEIARGLSSFVPTKMRMNVIRRGGDITVLNDAYNANPQSMRAAAAVLGSVPADRRKVAVLGDMLELGVNGELFHQAVGGYFAEAGVDCVIAVGNLARHIAQGAEKGGVPQVYYFETQEQAHQTISRELRAGTSILLKASRAMAFEKLVQYIIDHTAESAN
jgi:UDP-N-acetylmuramoyl-tripeptide--D-alanyl-D-alanine ligase